MKITRKKIYRYTRSALDRIGRRRLIRWYNNTRYLFRKPYIDVQSVMVVEKQGIYLRGWLLGPKNCVEAMKLELPGQPELDITARLVWQKDDDLSSRFGMLKHRLKPRFTGLIACDVSQLKQNVAVKLKFQLASGRTVSTKQPATQAQKKPLACIEKILSSVPEHAPEKRDLFDSVFGPTVQAIWASRDVPATDAEKVNYNEFLASQSPAASIVIPIYGRYDFIEYQLSEFVNDPDMFRYEIIYVIDDPRIADEVRGSVQVLEKIYRIPFSVVYLAQNSGFAGASNRGARMARSGNLLMLNSDIMPACNGWLAQLLSNVGDDIDNTITGVRLLYEDNAIQHNGMSFYASPFQNGLWTNTHPAKGLPVDQVDTRQASTECEAVTGACLLLSRDNFFALGGFDEEYILGDYEDSDLCMKARHKGLQIKLDDRVALYHLERQSQSLVASNGWKDQVTYYNCWLHTQKWHDAITELKQQRLVANG